MYILIAIMIIIAALLFLFGKSDQSNNKKNDLCCVDMDLCNKIRTYLKQSYNIMGAKWNYILPNELYAKMREGIFRKHNAPILLDVRRPEDYSKGHIPGAINIFWLDLMNNDNICKLAKLSNDMKKPVIVICYVGHTSSQILVLLRLLGFNAISLKYGMGISPVANVPRKGWIDYGFPVIKN